MPGGRRTLDASDFQSNRGRSCTFADRTHSFSQLSLGGPYRSRLRRGRCLGKQGLDFGPEPAVRLPLGLGELGKRRLVAQGGEVGILLPVTQIPHDLVPRRRRVSLEELGPGGQVGLQPVEGLLADAARATSSGGGSSLPLPPPASAAAQAAL